MSEEKPAAVFHLENIRTLVKKGKTATEQEKRDARIALEFFCNYDEAEQKG